MLLLHSLLCALVAFTSTTSVHHHHHHHETVADPEQDDSVATGACCFGDRSLGEDFTRDRCAYAWAGPGTDASDCMNRSPCCTFGACSHEQCFDCLTNGGTQIATCDECKPLTTTHPHTNHTSRTRSTHAPTPITHRHNTGCCCSTLTLPRKTTAEECHEDGDVYRGDGSSCNDSDICQARCCDPVTRVCDACRNFEDWSAPQFVGFGNTACCENACGVTCCVNAHATNAASSDACLRLGGTVLPNVAVADAVCPSGCCVGLNFTLVANREACEGVFLGAGVGFSPGVCGGCGCFSDHAPQIISEADCASNPTCVFQGVDVPCPKSGGKKRSVLQTNSSSDSDSWSEFSSSTLIDNSTFIDVCSNDGCCCYKDDIGRPTKKTVSDSLACYALHGVFKGEGVSCAECSCQGGVCCDGRAGFFVNSKAECDLKQLYYAGDGTDLSMSGVCDHQSGACYCDPNFKPVNSTDDDSDSESSSSSSHSRPDRHENCLTGDPSIQCFEVPNATVCERFGCGNAFQGVGTHCRACGTEGPPLVLNRTRGACCLPRSFDADSYVCELADNHAQCEFFGGVWNGLGSKCEDDTCSLITGRCCMRLPNGGPFMCVDGMTSAQCAGENAHWGGHGSLCDDQYSCDPKHVGACCRAGRSCLVTTPKVCRRGGRFQGFETTCQDLHNGICKVCAPCEVKAPSCSDAKPCENKHATCVHEYGKCMVLAASITVHDNSSWVGPLSCGDKHTIGMPCLAKALLGKCRIGVCQAPPKDSYMSGEFESVCWSIKDYECGCQCAGAWLKTCASISGRVINDKNRDFKYDDNDTLIGGAQVRIEIAHDGKWHFVSQQTTSEKGHYAFSGLSPGKYNVLVKLPGHFVTDTSHRTVDVECLEQSSDALRGAKHHLRVAMHLSAFSANLERRERETHLAEHIDFFAHVNVVVTKTHKTHTEDEDTKAPTHHQHHQQSDHDEDSHSKKPTTHHEHHDAHSDDKRRALHEEEEQHDHHHHHQQQRERHREEGSASTWVIILIVVLAVLCCLCCLGGCWWMRRKMTNVMANVKTYTKSGR